MRETRRGRGGIVMWGGTFINPDSALTWTFGTAYSEGVERGWKTSNPGVVVVSAGVVGCHIITRDWVW